MRVVLALLAPAVIAMALSLSTSSVVGTTPPPEKLPKQTVVWGDELFFARPNLAAWLRARGVTYREWAKRHPRAAARQRAATAPAD